MSFAATAALTEFWAKCKAYFQAKLVSGTNIKTVNNQSLLGSGNIAISGGGTDIDQYIEDYGPLTFTADNGWTTNTLDVDYGGTGATNAADARTNLGLGTAATHAHGDYALAGHTHSYLPLSGGTVDGDVEVSGTLTSDELKFSSTGAELQLSNQTKGARIALTGANNLRVDTSSDSGETWTTHGYAALGTQAPSATAYRAANNVFATPNGSAGLPSMRKLVAADMDGLGDTAYGAGQSGIASAKAAVSVAASTTVNLDTIVLAPGTWLVTYAVEFASNATGYRRVTLTTSASSVTSTPVYMESGPAANGFATNLSKTQVIVNSGTSNITRYLNVYHTGSAALNCRSCIQAVRIA